MSETSQLEDLLDRLESLVDRERQVLLEGRLDQIAQLVSEKSLLIEALRDTIPETAERIAPLQLKMRRNQELFDHALAGIRVVSDRLTHLREQGKAVQVYDALGRRETIGDAGETRLEHRV